MEKDGDVALVAKSSTKKRRLAVSIEHAPAEEGSLAPYAAFFPAGLPDSLHHRREEGIVEEGVNFEAYRSTAPFKSKHQLLIGRGTGIDYVGTNFPIRQGGRYALGLFNKADGSLKLTSVAGDKVFRMEPRVPGLEYEDDDAAAAVPEEELEKDQAAKAAERRAKREMLVETFGSRKARVQQNARQREKVEEDTIAAPKALASLLATAVDAVPTREEATRSVTSLESRLIPPCNPEATVPAGVYPADLLIPFEVQTALNLEPFQKAARHPDRPLKMYFGGEVSELVKKRVYKLSVEGDPRGSADRIKCLAYLAHLVDFYRLSPGKIQRYVAGRSGGAGDSLAAGKGVETLAQETGMPVIVLETFIERFLTKVPRPGGGTEYARPQKSADLTIAHILVASLHVDQFVSDPGDLAAALHMTVAQLVPRYKELGCKVRKLTKAQMEAAGKGSGYEVTLPVPVVFPALKRGR